jgi:long-chain acyl-CoA synthetase
MFSRRLAADPDTPFLFLPDGRSWTFRQIDELVQSLRARLVAHGVRPGEIVGLYQWNEPSWFATVLAVWSLGAVAALCGAVSPEAEAVRRFELVRPKAIVSSEASDFGGAWPCINVDLAGQVVRESPVGAAAPAPVAPVLVRPEDRSCIFFTSGTTGEAKALVKTHAHLSAAPRRTAATYSRSPLFRPRMAGPDKPPTLSFNPFGQTASFERVVFRLYIGRPVIMIRKFEVSVIKQLAAEHRLDTLQLTPAMVHMLAYTDEVVDLGSLKYVNCGTAPLPRATQDAFEKRYGVRVLQAYGSTEGGVTALESYADVQAGLRGPGSVGRITADSQWRIVDPAGGDVAPGEEGEIVSRPTHLTVLTADGETTLPLDDAGWYHTGDVGRVDEHGILYLTGRIKEMMIIGGFNVFPAEVENALRESALVRDAMVVPLKDDRLGEIPTAGIVWDPSAAAVTEAENLRRVTAELRNRLAAYKVPRRWFRLSSVPLTPNGKPDRRGAALTAAVEGRTIEELEQAAVQPPGAG